MAEFAREFIAMQLALLINYRANLAPKNGVQVVEIVFRPIYRANISAKNGVQGTVPNNYHLDDISVSKEIRCFAIYGFNLSALLKKFITSEQGTIW